MKQNEFTNELDEPNEFNKSNEFNDFNVEALLNS